MRTPLALLPAAFLAPVLMACGAAHSPGTASAPAPAAQRNLQALALAMDAIAGGRSTVTDALGPLTSLPAPASTQVPGNLRAAGFRDTEGHVVRDIEIRVRQGGIDRAPFVLSHLAPSPCASLETLSAQFDAREGFANPPSPHAPAGTPGVRGYVVRHAGDGELRLSASSDAPDCITLITARPPATQVQRHEQPYD